MEGRKREGIPRGNGKYCQLNSNVPKAQKRQQNKRPSLLMAFCHEFDGAGVSIELSY